MEIIRPPRRWIDDTRIAISASLRAAEFIYEHRVWEGFFRYRWVTKGLAWMMAILGVMAIHRVYDSWGSEEAMLSAANMSSFFTLEWLSSMTSGLGNYITLIAIEIIIFHFARRTLMIVTGEEIDTSWRTFLGAEMRMIRLAVFAFIMEILVKIVASIGINIADLDTYETAINTVIHSFYIGYAVIDNYNELYGMKLYQSHKYTAHYLPVALVVGGILAILLNLPIIGAIIGPVLCSVIATLAMNDIHQRDGSMGWAFVEKEKS